MSDRETPPDAERPGTPPDPTSGDVPRTPKIAAPGGAPNIDETVRLLGAAGKQSYKSVLDTSRAMRHLVAADLALARSAFGRALAWVAVAIVFGAASLLTLLGALIATLQRMGLSWLASISLAGGLSLAMTAVAAWRVMVFFDYTGMHATRRQLARYGIGDDPDKDEKNAKDDEVREDSEELARFRELRRQAEAAAAAERESRR